MEAIIIRKPSFLSNANAQLPRMSSGASQGPLEVALSRSNFTQTGSWSMLDIAKLTVQLPVGMISRYAAGRVNTHTVLVAEAMGMTFRMGQKGRANMEQAISKLSAVSTLGNSLSIGFGIEDFTRDMVKSEAGAMQMGLCAALKECYSHDVAIEVLLEYARQTKADGQWMPSNMEWRNLLDACAGCLAASDFALRAEHLMQLAKGERRLGAFGSLEAMPKKRRGCSAPKSIADALSALARLSNGRMASISLAGGPDAGWLAAVAEWFLDFKIKIIDGQSQETLYMNHVDDQNTQVTIVYSSHIMRDTGVPTSAYVGETVDPSSSVSRPKTSTGEVQVRDRTYHISLEDLGKSSLLDELDYNAHVVSGRLPWKLALRLAFGSDFERLMKTRNAFGEAIGSAAALFRAMVQAQPDIPTMYLSSNSGHSDPSYGQGLVVFVAQQLPELSDLRKVMEKTLRASFSEAKRVYEASMDTLAANCLCKACQTEYHNPSPSPVEEEKDERDHQDEKVERLSDGRQIGTDYLMDWDPNQYCSVLMVETIIRICRYLSNTVIHVPDLQPMRSGFELIYGRCLEVRRSSYRARKALKYLGQFAYCVDFDKDFDNEFNISERDGDREAIELNMYALLELYTGRTCRDIVGSTSALWLNGISAFFSVLTPSHGESSDHVGQIHLVPGRISFEGKSYTHLVDRKMSETDGFMAKGGNLVRPDYALEAHDRFAYRTINIREGSTYLQCLMRFTRDIEVDSGSSKLSVGPSALAAILAKRRGLVHCNSSRTGRKCPPLPDISGKEYGEPHRWVEYKHKRKLIMIMKPCPGMDALATIAFLASSCSQCWTYIVDSQCESCCIRAAITNDRRERRKFCFVYVS